MRVVVRIQGATDILACGSVVKALFRLEKKFSKHVFLILPTPVLMVINESKKKAHHAQLSKSLSDGFQPETWTCYSDERGYARVYISSSNYKPANFKLNRIYSRRLS